MLYAATFDLVRCLSIVGAFTAPSFAFLGVTFPAGSMSIFAQLWRDLMPATHFLDLYTAQINYGAAFPQLLTPMLILAAYLIVLPWVILKLHTAVSKQIAKENNVSFPTTT